MALFDLIVRNKPQAMPGGYFPGDVIEVRPTGAHWDGEELNPAEFLIFEVDLPEGIARAFVEDGYQPVNDPGQIDFPRTDPRGEGSNDIVLERRAHGLDLGGITLPPTGNRIQMDSQSFLARIVRRIP